MRLLKALAFAAGTFFITSMAFADEVELSDVPQRAQETIRQHVGEGEIKEIERSERDGRNVYEVEFQSADDREQKLKVGEDGRVLERQRDN